MTTKSELIPKNELSMSANYVFVRRIPIPAILQDIRTSKVLQGKRNKSSIGRQGRERFRSLFSILSVRLAGHCWQIMLYTLGLSVLGGEPGNS